MSAPDLPRYVIASVLGFPIRTDRDASSRGSGWKALRSFSVLDTWVANRIVEEFVTRSGATETDNMLKAHELCVRLNAEHEAQLARSVTL